jgi:sugar phosphate isomerase/epimerase
VFTTGPAGQLPWERAADAFEEVMRGFVLEAERERVPLAIEHTNSLRADVGFVHTLRDAIELAWRIGTGVCMEVNACWAERNLGGTIAAGIDAIDLVQVSDYAIGTRTTPERLVPGDGDIPLRRIVDTLLDAGYTGLFDVEVIGPRIEEEGYERAIERSVTYVEGLLEPPAEDSDATSAR